MKRLITWLLAQLNLVRASEAHDEEVYHLNDRAKEARKNALVVQVDLHRRGRE